MIDIERIYKLYFHDVYKYLIKLSGDPLLAEEITAETFMKVIKNKESFKGESHIKTWLIQIVRNSYINHINKESKQIVTDEIEQFNQSSSFEGKLFEKYESIEIHKILHTMQEPYKEVFSLRVFSELSFREIGEVFDKTENWACVTYYRAKEKIKKEVLK